MRALSLISTPLRFARRVLLPLTGLLIILLAVLLSVARLALPLFDEQARHFVEQAALERGLALEVERLSLDWEGLGPRLSLHNTRIKGTSDSAPLQLQTLSLHFDLPRSILSGRLQFATLEISGLVLHLQRDPQGHWGLSSLDTSPPTSHESPASWPAWMGMAQKVVLRQAQLHVNDAISGLKLNLDAVEALFEQGMNAQGALEQRFVLKMQLPETLGGVVELRAHLQGTLADLSRPTGELWLDTPQLKLPGWRALFASLPNGDLALPVALSDLPQLKTGELGGQTWISLQQGGVTDVQASLDFNDVLLKRAQPLPNSPPRPLLAPLASHVNIHLQHHDALWTFDLDTTPDNSRVDKRSAPTDTQVADALRLSTLQKTTNAPDDVQRFSMRREGDILALAAEHIDLSLLRPWLIATPILPESTRRSLQRHRPLGLVQDLRLRLDLSQEPAHAQGHACLSDFGWQSDVNLPGITGIDAQAWLDGQRALLRLDSENVSIDSAGHLRERLRFNQLQGDISVFLPAPDATHPTSKLAIHNLKLNNSDLELALDVRLDLPAAGSPLIDATGSLNNVVTERMLAYLPVQAFTQDVLDWLDHALPNSQGLVPHAAIRTYGALDQFPYFLNNSGLFSVIADFEHLNLNYAPTPAPGWKPAEKLYGQLSFINNGLSGVVHQGHIQGVMLDTGTLTIADYDHPRLDLALKLHGDSAQMLDVLKHSPLIKNPKDLDALNPSGAAQLDLAMDISLISKDQIPDRVEGWYRPQNARLQTFGLDFSKLNGELHFVNLDFDSQNLHAELKHTPAQIRVSSHLSPKTAQTERGYHIEIDTKTQVSDWLQPEPSILAKLPGRFPLQAKLILSDDPLKHPDMRLDLASDLTGLTIDFPAPINKAAATPRPTTARLNIQNAKIEHLSLTQPGLLQGQFNIHDQGIRAGAVHFGDDDYGKSQELKADELHLSGTLDSFNLDEWIAAMSIEEGKDSTFLPPTLRINSKIRQLHALGSLWDEVAIEGVRNSQDWNVKLDAPRLSGQILLPHQSTPETPVQARFSRLMFPETPPNPSAPFEPSPIVPSSLPVLHLNIDELWYGELKLHNIDLNAMPQAASSNPKGESAWIINTLTAKDSHLTLQGKAAWYRTSEGHPHSALELELSSDDVGEALTETGFKHALRKGQFDDSRLSLSWPGGLQQFDWTRAYGKGQMHILDGKIDKVELGVGRVLGLISLTELPRRLILDFGDVFGDGLHFERLDSEMTLNDGKLNTTCFNLTSSALKLNISGYSDMRDQSLHYQMEATPSLGNVLPIVGAVAGGPIVGGATFVAQKLFELAGGSFVTLYYQIGGTWDNPIIERAQAPSSTEPPANATEPTPP